MGKYLKNWGFLAGSDLVSQAFGFLIIVKLAKILSPDNFGVYNIVLALSSIFAILANFGMTQVIIRTIAKFPFSTSKFLKNLLPLRIATIGITIIVSYIYNLISKDVSFYILLGTILLTVDTSVWDYVESVSFGKKITTFTSVINITFTIIWAAFVFITPHDLLTLSNVIIIYCVVTTLKSVIVVFVSLRKNIYESVGEDGEYEFNRADFFKESLPYLWLWGIGVFVNQVPLLLLNKHSHISEVGFFSVGSKLIIPLTTLVSTIFRALFPFMSEFYHKDKLKFNKIIVILYTFIVVIGSSIAFCATLLSRFIIPMLFGKQYVSSVGSFNYLIWSAVIYSIDLMIGNVLSAANKQGLLAKLATIDLLIGFPLMYFGSYYGSTGLALSRLAFIIIAMTYHWIILIRLISANTERSDLFTFKNVIVIYLFLALAFSITKAPIDLLYQIISFVLLVGIYYFIKNSPIKYLINNFKIILKKDIS